MVGSSVSFKEQQRSGSADGHAVVRSRIPRASLKENVMRVTMLAIAAILICAATPTPAQTVIDVEGQKAASPSVPDQDKVQPPDQVRDQPHEGSAPGPPSRFTFSRVNNGFLRLDNDSGQVAYCSVQGRGWTCQAAPENRPALETEIAGLQDDVAALQKLKAEIAALQDGVTAVKKLQAENTRLQDEVASLKKEVLALKEPPPPRPPADLTPPADKNDDVTIKLPTREDMARARAFIQDTWRRLVDMINTVQKDVMRKG